MKVEPTIESICLAFARADELALNSLQAAVELCREAGVVAEEIGDASLAAQAFHRCGDFLQRCGLIADAREVFTRSINHALESANRGTHACALLGLSICSAFGGDAHGAQGAQQLAEQALAIALEIGDPKAEAMALNMIGLTKSSLGDHIGHARALFQAGEAARRSGDRRMHWMIQNNTALLYYSLGETDRAKALWSELYEEGNAKVDSIAQQMAIHSAKNLARCMHNEELFEEAERYIVRARELAVRLGMQSEVHQSDMKIAMARLGIGDLSAADSLLRSAIEGLRNHGLWNEVVYCHVALGEMHKIGGNIAEAILALERAEAISAEHSTVKYRETITRELSDMYRMVGDFERADRYSSEFHELKAQRTSAEVARAVVELEVSRELERLRDEAEAKRLEAERVRRKLDSKQHELADSAIELAKHAESLGRIKNEIEAIARDITSTEPAVRRLREKLRELPGTSSDWTRFDADFQNTYPEFRQNLSERWPALSKVELKVCSLLRLRLTSEEIARLLCISERTAEDHRYRIRKKLELTREQDLHEFLATI